jgi:aldehyde:ferredoxin oxidoreductase
MKDEYYELRGWDSGSGLQHRDTLERLNLSFLVPELEALKKIL